MVSTDFSMLFLMQITFSEISFKIILEQYKWNPAVFSQMVIEEAEMRNDEKVYESRDRNEIEVRKKEKNKESKDKN